jgi:hypothetical protein
MTLLLNLIIAIVAGFIADYILGRVGVADPIKVVLAVLVAIVVFLANPAGYF